MHFLRTLNLAISPGGIVTAGLAIYDTMRYVRPEICTICMGQAASMGSLLLTAGSPDMRFILPNAKVRRRDEGWEERRCRCATRAVVQVLIEETHSPLRTTWYVVYARSSAIHVCTIKKERMLRN